MTLQDVIRPYKRKGIMGGTKHFLNKGLGTIKYRCDICRRKVSVGSIKKSWVSGFLQAPLTGFSGSCPRCKTKLLRGLRGSR